MQKVIVIGGGAAGIASAVHLARAGKKVTILEGGERLGRKLSATGNGQGNVTNLHVDATHYFSDDLPKVARALACFGYRDTVEFLESMGGIFLPDSRGRVYPASRQASAVTDLFRFELERLGVEVYTGVHVEEIFANSKLRVTWEGGSMSADAIVLAAGGKAAPNYGTDGSAYRLAEKFGHTVTPLTPALVQLKCDPTLVRGLKGIRIEGGVCVLRKGKLLHEGRGDVLFTESGISGDAIFRASSYCRDGDVLEIDLLPDVDEARLARILAHGEGERTLLCVLPNGLSRFLYKKANGDRSLLIRLIKCFPLPITGNLGFVRAQVTKGGIPLAETDENLQSAFCKGLYFAGEILNVDGECGGYNLQWAFTSAYLAAKGVISC